MEQLSGFLSSDPGGGTGTKDYNQLENKPSVNGVELAGNKTLQDLGLLSAEELQRALQEVVEEVESKIPKNVSDLQNDSDYQTADQVQAALRELENKIPDVSGMESTVDDLAGLVERQGNAMEELGQQLEDLQRTVDGFVDGNEVGF